MQSDPTSVVHSCPYARVLDHSAKREATHETPDAADAASSETSNALRLAKEKCPAFASGCPFSTSGASGTVPSPAPESILEAMKQIPKSHLANDGEASVGLRAALTHVHGMATRPEAEVPGEFRLDGRCPFRTVVDGRAFVDVMEGLSLAAAVAKMADSRWGSQFTTPPPHVISTESAVGSLTISSKRRLSAELKNGTVESHKMAEEVHFVRNFIKGDIRRESFVDLTVNLYFVYEALEKALDVHAKILGKLYRPDELRRAPALRDDVDFWTGRDVDELRPSLATEDYVRRIRKLSASDPLLLVAHAYTRYMGDLSGGTILARVARRALGLSKDGDGLRFYDFGKVSAKVFKDEYRVALDEMDLDEDAVHRLVDEANVAFVLNMRLFQEIDVAAGVGGTAVVSLEEALAAGGKATAAMKKKAAQTDPVEEEKCPFGFTSNTKKPAGHGRTANKASKSPAKPSAADVGAKPDRCPWPYVIFHDPGTFMRDYQTFVLFAFLFCWANWMGWLTV